MIILERRNPFKNITVVPLVKPFTRYSNSANGNRDIPKSNEHSHFTLTKRHVSEAVEEIGYVCMRDSNRKLVWIFTLFAQNLIFM